MWKRYGNQPRQDEGTGYCQDSVCRKSGYCYPGQRQAQRRGEEDSGRRRVGYLKLGKPTDERHILVSKGDATYQFGIDYMRDVWYSSSYLLDRKQSMNGCAKKRFENYKMQPVEFAFMPEFKGKLSQYGITPDRRTPSGVRAAIIREKGTNGEREMAYSLYLAGFDVKDVTMTDLISGRETLEDVNMIVYCGGFSNSDVLGSAKGWAGGFLFNEKAKEALDKFYAREDTLSLGICNGCQLMMELGLINPEHKKKGKMLHNDSHKFESTFVGLTIPTNRSVMFGSLSGSKLGIWVAHGEGKFSLPYDEDKYNVVAKYSYDEYPGNRTVPTILSPDLPAPRPSSGYDASLGTRYLPMAERLLSGRPQK